MNILKKNQRGVSFIELIIYLAIVGAVFTSLMRFSWSISQARNKTYVVQEVQSTVRLISAVLNQKIRSAQSVIDPQPGMSLDSLILDIQESDSDMVFDLQDGVLRFISGVGDPVVLNGERVVVSDFNVSNIAEEGERDRLLITMTINYKNNSEDRGFDYSEDLQLTIGLKI